MYTPPTARGNGFASANVGAISVRLLGIGVDACLLYTQLSNSTYQRLGYEPVSEILRYQFGDAAG